MKWDLSEANSKPGQVFPGRLLMSGMPVSVKVPILQLYFGSKPTRSSQYKETATRSSL